MQTEKTIIPVKDGKTRVTPGTPPVAFPTTSASESSTVLPGLPSQAVETQSEPHRPKTRLLSLGLILAAVIVGVGAIGWYATHGKTIEPATGNSDDKDKPPIELAKGSLDSLVVPPSIEKSIGMLTSDGALKTAVARPPLRTRPLEMLGTTALDPARLIRIRVRFAPADVAEIAMIPDPHSPVGSTTPQAMRELRVDDVVKKDQLLAVLRSVDVGNKKNDLFDALSQQKLDEDVLKRAEKERDAVPEVFLLNARRNVEADVNNVNRAENTLRTWAIPEADIQAVRTEAQQIKSVAEKRKHEKESLEQWSRVELRAPDSGVIIEQNVALHETVVDNTTNLFQIARVDQLLVIASVPEDELPALHELESQTQGRVQWTVTTVGALSIKGFIDGIGYLIDPNQHTAVVRGHIPNVDGSLRAGQFVTASVELLPPKNVVEIPMNAIDDDGREAVVFVQKDPAKQEFTRRRVLVTNRFEKTAYVRSTPMPKDDNSPTVGEGDGPVAFATEPLMDGERVLTAGVLELKATLSDKQSEARAQEAQAKAAQAKESLNKESPPNKESLSQPKQSDAKQGKGS
jgi:cobalt-zinc-cadmium efflux system membrane fusion protein